MPPCLRNRQSSVNKTTPKLYANDFPSLVPAEKHEQPVNPNSWASVIKRSIETEKIEQEKEKERVKAEKEKILAQENMRSQNKKIDPFEFGFPLPRIHIRQPIKDPFCDPSDNEDGEPIDNEYYDDDFEENYNGDEDCSSDEDC